MKNINKILTVAVLLAITLLLTSCRKKPDRTFEFAFYDVDSTQLVVETLNNSKKLETFNIYQVLAAGQVELFNGTGINNATDIIFYDIDGNVLLEDDLTNAVKKVYNYELNIDGASSLSITQFKANTNLDESFIYVDYLKLNEEKNNQVIRNGAILRNSYLFEGQNLEFFEISPQGSKDIEVKDLTFTGFPVGDALIENKEFINNRTFEITASKDSLTQTFNIRLNAENKPLSHKTATFWNWIFLKMPIAYLMSFIGSITGQSFAIAILVATIIVRTLAWPIYAKTNDMSLKMTLAQPDLDKLQQKYAARKDPESQQKMQMEMMAIYKKHNINFFGCLLPFLQMPIFIAMFQVVSEITIPGGQFYDNVKNTKFFLTDLNAGGIFAKIVFTALVALTMYALQKISQIKPSYSKQAPVKSNPQAEQQQQTMKMVSFMMIFMMVMTAYITPGLALSYYWIIGNVYSLGQTLLNRKVSEKKYYKLEEEKLYGKSREIVDAQFKKKGDA